MSRGNREQQPMRVVIINTQYVETDAINFKSVVQRFTGKDSTEGREVEPARKKMRSVGLERIGSRVDHHHHHHHHHMSSSCGTTASNSVFSRGVSFKDFDRLLKELPPLDELYRLCAD